ncbi:hypothetical protein BC834DRAFT_149693 [Gloeopeniophorella convolvens]|nr:hypothetical protein BC834DRAFT_149693 [Gloeopeniophorella convolvens]
MASWHSVGPRAALHKKSNRVSRIGQSVDHHSELEMREPVLMSNTKRYSTKTSKDGVYSNAVFEGSEKCA